MKEVEEKENCTPKIKEAIVTKEQEGKEQQTSQKIEEKTATVEEKSEKIKEKTAEVEESVNKHIPAALKPPQPLVDWISQKFSIKSWSALNKFYIWPIHEIMLRIVDLQDEITEWIPDGMSKFINKTT